MPDERSITGDDAGGSGGDASGSNGSSGGGYDDVFNDEVKVYKYEGDQDQPASENLSEDKIVLVTDAEENIKQSEEDSLSPEIKNHINGLIDNPFSRRFSSFPSFIPPYPYPGCSGPLGLGPVSVPHPGFPFYNDLFAQPPPAHMGFPSWSLATPPGFCTPTPMYALPGQASPFYGLSATHQGPSIYPTLPPSQLASSFYSPSFSPVPTWPHGTGYPFPCYPQFSKLQSTSMLGSHLGFSYPGISHPALVSNINQSQEGDSPPVFRSSGNYLNKKLDSSKLLGSVAGNNSINNKAVINITNSHSSLNPFSFDNSHQLHHHLQQQQLSRNSHPQKSEFTTPPSSFPRGGSRSPILTSSSSSSSSNNKLPHIKKPLNAFMLFMKEMRQKVIDECTLKESAAINQILGRKWHSLDRTEQTKYYDMARREKELHRQLYPSWTARDNYAIHARKKKRKEMMRDDDRGIDGGGEDRNAIDCMNAKKCRARYGVEQQFKWCKPCRRKKRCIRFMHDNNSDPFDENDDENSSMSSRNNNNVNKSNNNNNCNNNTSVADSTTEIFSPISSTNTDDSRNRCCQANQSMEDISTVHQPLSVNHAAASVNKKTPMLGGIYPSMASHGQNNLNSLQSNFTIKSPSLITSPTNQNLATPLLLSNQEYASQSSTNHTSVMEMTLLASTNQNGRCSQLHYTPSQQQSISCHQSISAESQSRLNISYPVMVSPDMSAFATNGLVSKKQMPEGRHLQQSTTIF